MAALALSMSTALAKPPLIAARRVDFHLKGNSLSRWKYRQVDCFICVSEAIRSMLIADGVPAARAVVVNEGIDLERVDAAPPGNLHEELWLPRHAPIVGNVAALVPHKGQRHLIDAAAIVVRQMPDARFVIAGEGELRHALERQIRERHLEKHVILLGFRPDVLSLHKVFDVFVMSSVTEGLARRCSMPWRAASPSSRPTAGGIPEVVEDGAHGSARSAAGSRGDGRRDHPTAARRGSAPANGRGGDSQRARALQRRADGARHVARLPAGRDARTSRGHSGRAEAERIGVHRGTAASPARHPDRPRGHSSNVIARPFSENVTPRAIDWFGPVCGCTSVICPAGAKLEGS